MSTTYQAVATGQMSDPAERLRLLGQKMGLWNHGFDFPRFARQLVREIDFHDKRMLEIGCGKGMLCLWAALAQQLELPQAKILPHTVQAFDAADGSFDVVLSVASINHLDEKSCIALRESPLAVRAYQEIFRRIARMMKPGGKLIIIDAARRNLFGDFGVRNPMSPNIEWFKHQQPEDWARLLRSCGFGDENIRWTSGKLLRYAGVTSVPKVLSYCGQSLFRLEMTRSR